MNGCDVQRVYLANLMLFVVIAMSGAALASHKGVVDGGEGRQYTQNGGAIAGTSISIDVCIKCAYCAHI